MTETSSDNQTHRQDELLNKRIEDLKWYIGVFSGSVAFLVAGLSVIVGLNLSSERSSLRDYKDEIRAEIRESLGKSPQPSLQLQTLDKHPLDGATIEAWLTTDSNKVPMLNFRYSLLNKGKGRSGPFFLRCYSSNIPFNDPNTDDTGHKYSTFIDSSNFSPAELLGGVSMPYTASVEVPPDFKIADGQTSLRVRMYYGNGELVEADIKLRKSK